MAPETRPKRWWKWTKRVVGVASGAVWAVGLAGLPEDWHRWVNEWLPALWGVLSNPNSLVAIKGLDTVLVRTDTTEVFGYTNLVFRDELEEAELRGAPLVAQQALTDKLDLRVTVVQDDWWCASVTERGSGIPGDWRLKQSDVVFSEFELPQAVGVRCLELTRRLGLSFSAIDLALSDDRFFFLEVNPTGEWAWLQEEAQFPIASKLADLLARTGSGRCRGC